MNFSLRHASAADRDFLWDLYCTTMREVIATTWGWEESWQRTDFARKFTQCEVSIIEIDGHPGGSLWLEMRPDALHIAELQLLPDLQGRGIGTTVVNGVVARAAERSLPVELSVVPANPRARQLYERLGFEVVAVAEPCIHMRLGTQR